MSFDQGWRDWAETIDPPKPKVPWWASLMANCSQQPSYQALQAQAQCSPEQLLGLQNNPVGCSSWINGALGGLAGGLGL